MPARLRRLFGGHKAVVRPDPFPNSAVKHSLADGSGCIASARVGCRQIFPWGRNIVSAPFFSSRPSHSPLGDCPAPCLTPIPLNEILNLSRPAAISEPLFYVGIFLASSFLMIWRLEAMGSTGLEGTVMGTLIMPYCSGLGNLIFAFVIGRNNGSGSEVLTNCLVNNVTNLTLLIGLPALFWGLAVMPGKTAKKKKGKNPDQKPRMDRLSLLLTLAAVLFFTGAAWAVSRDGKIDFNDGLVLVGLFLFWQMFQVFDVLRGNVRQNRKFGIWFWLDVALLLGGAYGIYVSTDWLVAWLSHVQSGFVSAKQIGWLSGWLMVLPNGLLAFYYAWKKKAEIVYTSQIGDGHICIPLCVGIFALYKPVDVPSFFETGLILLAGATLLHLIFVALLGRLPRIIGFALALSYGVFVYRGIFVNAGK